ncbi:hypothetical protein [Cupriavidus basilensis]|uniref:hypothetical protein n=1 Tax=Cupriavidus basilensis TaxID=68895 RepID=UPI0023E78644|nr:hypothetical protein [Cupriavidus basilensis]MDF3886328.1 hypothetical protein [Cupriavidus basilensis]
MNTLKEVLARLTNDQLKSLMRWLPDAARAGKKDELVREILRTLSGDGLHALWARLDETQRLAVAETMYATDGLFHETRFQAKYGRLPDFTIKENGRRYSHYGPPTALGLFLYHEDGGYSLPVDLCERLRPLVPQPEPIRLNTIGTLPEMRGEDPLTVRSSERDAIVDLSVLLRLADQGKIQVSDKTSLPSATTLRLLTEKLVGGDFYAHQPKQDQRDLDIGPLKAFSWPLLLQAAGLVQRNGSKLALSTAGLKALTASPASVLRTIWRKWLKSSQFDEFSRIDIIKGQKSKGRVMTAAAPRRAVINEILQRCPVGAWINVDDFSRFMQATGHTFDVAHDPWKLYIVDQQYGSLGYDGPNAWAILQFRYLLCFLFEYVATLGIIDVAYIDPSEARQDFGNVWGTDDLEFLSRYDGLVYFRLTPLGAYCLGVSEDYTPTPIQLSVRLSVSSSLQVNVVGGHLSAEESLTLDTWSIEEAGKSWRLDRQKALDAIEKGHDIAELRAFLQARDDQPLPEKVESFIKTSQKQGKALRIIGTTLLIDCEDAETAAMIATRKEAAGLCLHAGDRQLVVRLENEEKFRALIRVLGLGITT